MWQSISYREPIGKCRLTVNAGTPAVGPGTITTIMDTNDTGGAGAPGRGTEPRTWAVTR